MKQRFLLWGACILVVLLIGCQAKRERVLVYQYIGGDDQKIPNARYALHYMPVNGDFQKMKVYYEKSDTLLVEHFTDSIRVNGRLLNSRRNAEIRKALTIANHKLFMYLPDSSKWWDYGKYTIEDQNYQVKALWLYDNFNSELGAFYTREIGYLAFRDFESDGYYRLETVRGMSADESRRARKLVDTLMAQTWAQKRQPTQIQLQPPRAHRRR